MRIVCYSIKYLPRASCNARKGIKNNSPWGIKITRSWGFDGKYLQWGQLRLGGVLAVPCIGSWGR
ncbi:hypothetical protein RintRC_3300 [Richelia intracellularis]|nr:hypothetical protein RintRC_3300 [Richelia intracellularis]